MLVDRLRRNSIDALSLFILPCLLALLPRRVGFAVMKRMARLPALYRDSVEPAWAVAREFMPLLDEAQFRQRFRLLRLTDQVDSFLTLFRSAGWWRRQVDVVGNWPTQNGPFLLLTYHWGAGNWIWKLLRQRGIASYFVARRAGYRDMGLGGVAYWYGRYRGWALRRMGCAGPIYLGGSTPRLRAALAAGESVMGMLDLPADPQQPAFAVECLQRSMRFPRGLVDLAIAEGIPVVLLSCGLDAATGRRDLRIESLPIDLDAGQIAARYAQHFATRLGEQPEYWQLWVVGKTLFSDEQATDQP